MLRQGSTARKCGGRAFWRTCGARVAGEPFVRRASIACMHWQRTAECLAFMLPCTQAPGFSFAAANEALGLYQIGQTERAIKWVDVCMYAWCA